MIERASRFSRRAVMAGASALALTACASNGGPDPTLEAEARTALQRLQADNPGARAIGARAVAILVFPRVTRAGFLVGGAGGKGVLFRGGQPAGYFRTTAVSYGLQAGVQAYSYALFFMNEAALADLEAKDGWEIGVGPTVVVVDAGKAAQLSTTTASDSVYAFIWGQQGLMAGVDLGGSKISRVK